MVSIMLRSIRVFGLRNAVLTGNRCFGTTGVDLKRSCKKSACRITEKPGKTCTSHDGGQDRQTLPTKVTSPRKLSSLTDWCGRPIEELGGWDKSRRARMVFPRLPDPCNKSQLKMCKYCPAYCCKRHPELECGALKEPPDCETMRCKQDKKCR